MHVFDPQGYFDNCHLQESRVLGFAYNESSGQVRLDIDYAAEVVSHWFEAKLAGVRLDEYQPLPSDFRRFTFSEVSWIEIDPMSYLSHECRSNEWTDLLKCEDSRSPIIATFNLVRAEKGFIAKVVLERMGDFRFVFAFSSLSVQKRLGRSVLVDEKRSLFEDVDTHTIFDFRNPFHDSSSS